MLLTHVGLQLFVFLELQSAALKLTNVFLLLLGVNAADVSDPVGVGGEGLLAAIHRAPERFQSGMSEIMPRQVVRATEGLTAAIAVTCVRLQSRVFTQVSVQFPLFIVSRRAAGKRTNITFLLLPFNFHFCDIEDYSCYLFG